MQKETPQKMLLGITVVMVTQAKDKKKNKTVTFMHKMFCLLIFANKDINQP